MKHLRRFNESISDSVEDINDIFTVEVADHFNLVRVSYDEYEDETDYGGPLEINISTDPAIYYIKGYDNDGTRKIRISNDCIRIKMAISDDNNELFKLKYLSLFEERISKIGFKMTVSYYPGNGVRRRRRNFTEVTMIIERI